MRVWQIVWPRSRFEMFFAQVMFGIFQQNRQWNARTPQQIEGLEKKKKNVFFQCSVFQISVISVVGFFKFPWKKSSLGVGLFLMI